ncbi:hypothetical protein THAR02_03121 [Trichoderma harzianum]|uniref:Retrotransposon gag domain-containing protein n=1 Tax=Trichoderma harzianum TaxID=5544 RepID=A0A0G0AIM9_TRIHA|nr:hypothetical protein THAR02_03121 [Trichoderma harzianum]
MVAETPEVNLLKLWESIPKELRPSGSYTFDALSSTVASLVAKAQESSSSQCEHKNELAKALGKVCTVDDSWKDLLEITRKAAWKSYTKLAGNKPRPFNGTISDYPRWKADIRNWAAMNGAVPGDILAAAVLQNTTGPAKQWTLNKKIDQYSKTDGVPVSSAATLEAILKDMDWLFSDPHARDRAYKKYLNTRQGTRPILEYNIYFYNLVVEFGEDPEIPSSVVRDYIRSLRPGVQESVQEWYLESIKDPSACTLSRCMRIAARRDYDIPVPKKKGRQQQE